ncbi:uncharacterized protein BT62DRAFT_1080392 [Guyanagaster necrorhizus]|uniref:Uncharacterized protein n=1 Tax=Guyanagaster necrorhizus TaxID=856835 RepID=A0A9P7VH97_9AGAR|nr:uncharacterized protein BT62DRAFT_1080392 [Guyanagaster necrorhizus MCA 3950]KAG7441016.1 hypothetical protein BT62DRAFT_1080392 [Guyanagaster necrorhizus MCA 3950]
MYVDIYHALVLFGAFIEVRSSTILVQKQVLSPFFRYLGPLFKQTCAYVNTTLLPTFEACSHAYEDRQRKSFMKVEHMFRAFFLWGPQLSLIRRLVRNERPPTHSFSSGSAPLRGLMISSVLLSTLPRVSTINLVPLFHVSCLISFLVTRAIHHQVTNPSDQPQSPTIQFVCPINSKVYEKPPTTPTFGSSGSLFSRRKYAFSATRNGRANLSRRLTDSPRNPICLSPSEYLTSTTFGTHDKTGALALGGKGMVQLKLSTRIQNSNEYTEKVVEETGIK